MLLPEPYHEDSLLTLDGAGIAGVLVIAAVLALIAVLATWRLARRQILVIRMVVAVMVFAIFEWLSPQAFYAFYQTIFDGLPSQWVARFPTLPGLLEVIGFQSRPSLSSHGRGVLFWLLLIVALLAGRRFRRNAAN